MRLSTTNLASAGAVMENLKALSKHSDTLKHLLWQMKTEMGKASVDITAFHRTTRIHKRQASGTGLWSRVWQSMQSIVASFRSRLSQLITSIQRKQHPAHSHQMGHHQAGAKSSAHRSGLANFAKFRPRANSGNMKRRVLSPSASLPDVESMDEALLMIRELSDGLLDSLSPDDFESQLENSILWSHYSEYQRSMIQEAINQAVQARKSEQKINSAPFA